MPTTTTNLRGASLTSSFNGNKTHCHGAAVEQRLYNGCKESFNVWHINRHSKRSYFIFLLFIVDFPTFMYHQTTKSIPNQRIYALIWSLLGRRSFQALCPNQNSRLHTDKQAALRYRQPPGCGDRILGILRTYSKSTLWMFWRQLMLITTYYHKLCNVLTDVHYLIHSSQHKKSSRYHKSTKSNTVTPCFIALYYASQILWVVIGVCVCVFMNWRSMVTLCWASLSVPFSNKIR